MPDYQQITGRLIQALGPVADLHRTSPLDHCDTALEVLLATILTQNTNDRNAIKAWMNYKARFSRPEDGLAASEAEIAATIRIAGLAAQKAAAIRKVLAATRERFGDFRLERLTGPDEAWAFLNGLPGVGPKTAACTMVFGLRLPAFPVDTHIHRVTLRLGWVPERTDPAKAQALLTTEVPAGLHHDLHILLLNLGRRYCHPKQPECRSCPLEGDCGTAKKFT